MAGVQMLLVSSGESAVSRRACCRYSVLSIECVVRGVCVCVCVRVLSVECVVSRVYRQWCVVSRVCSEC